MMALQRTFCLLFVAWLSVSAGSFDARRSSTQRVRAARCPRLELDHHADQSHEGESHSLDAHYAHHQLLEAASGGFAPMALALEGDAVLAAAGFSAVTGAGVSRPASARASSCGGLPFAPDPAWPRPLPRSPADRFSIAFVKQLLVASLLVTALYCDR